MLTPGMEQTILKLHEDLDTMETLPCNRKMAAALSGLREDLDAFLDSFAACVDGLQAKKESDRELFDLRYRRLTGLAEEMTAFARKKPEAVCNAFKLAQVNQALLPLKEEMEPYLDISLALCDGEGFSYSDVSLLLRSYLDTGAVYARRRYGLNYYENRKQ